jgi:hypothetical protein
MLRRKKGEISYPCRESNSYSLDVQHLAYSLYRLPLLLSYCTFIHDIKLRLELQLECVTELQVCFRHTLSSSSLEIQAKEAFVFIDPGSSVSMILPSSVFLLIVQFVIRYV